MRTTIQCLVFIWVISGVPLVSAEPAGEHFLICIPGGPGSPDEAKERLKVFLNALGDGVVPLEGHYAVTREACDAVLKERNPRFALFSHGELQRRGSALKAKPLLTVIPLDNLPLQYHIVARSGVSMESLKGKTLVTPHWQEEKFLSSVVFERDLSAYFEGKKGSALRALKKVYKGKADATLLNAVEFASMKELPFAGELQAVASSPELPGLAIVEIGGISGLGKKLQSSGKKLCATRAEACKTVEMLELVPASPQQYRKIIK